GLAQRQDAERVRVAGAPVLERLLGRLADHRRGLEVRLPELQMDDVDALPLERLRPLEHLHGQERLDLLRAARDHDGRPPRGNRSTRRRAASTSRSMRGPWRSTLTLEPGWSAQFTGTSVTR